MYINPERVESESLNPPNKFSKRFGETDATLSGLAEAGAFSQGRPPVRPTLG
jgi:hypothetical protein